MVTPQRSDRTLALRRFALDLRRGRIRNDAPIAVEDIPEREELTRPGLPTLPEQSEPRTLHQQWVGLPMWARVVLVIAPTVPPIVVAIVQLVSALR